MKPVYLSLKHKNYSTDLTKLSIDMAYIPKKTKAYCRFDVYLHKIAVVLRTLLPQSLEPFQTQTG